MTGLEDFETCQNCEVKRCRGGEIAMMLSVREVRKLMTETVTTVNAENFFKLPKGSQVFVAYALTHDVWEMQLLKTDRDMLPLLNFNWLVVMPTTTHGVVNGHFPDEVWLALETFEDKVMNSVSRSEMERFIARKGKEYPWLWGQ